MTRATPPATLSVTDAPHDPAYARARNRLLARIHRRFRTLTEPVQLGGRTFAFTRIADPNRVLDEVAAAADRRERLGGPRADGDALHLPYWAELWDSALAIGQMLLKRAIPLLYPRAGDVATPRLSVLDLGCGMGLTGTVAAAMGHRVTFADLESPALLFARLNSLSDAPRVRTRQLNWQTARLPDRFDLILGADILYERGQWAFLEPFWQHHLASGGSVLLGEPGRPGGDSFAAHVTSRGWRLVRYEEPVPTRRLPIRVFELRRG